MKNLKFVFIALLICLFSGKIKAQTDSTKKSVTTTTVTTVTTTTTTEVAKEKLKITRRYFSFAIGGAGDVQNKSGNVGGISFSYVLSNNWGFNVSYRGYTTRANALPEDYSAGLQFFGDNTPKDNLQALSFRVSKEIPTSSPNVRFALESGISGILYKTSQFGIITSPSFFGSSHKVTKNYQPSIGLSLRAKAEIIFGRKFGMELATIANINEFQSYFGGEIALNFGMLRRKTAQ